MSFGAPPLGPWRLAHYLQANGQHVDVWDCNVSPALKLPAPDEHGSRDRAEVLAEAFVAGIEGDFDVASYDFIGFSILSDTLPSTLGVIELLRKKYPLARLIGGNHEATVNLGDCVGKSHLDGVILADAEEPMLALMRGQAPHEIPGVLWRTHNPKPAREKFEEWNRLIRWGEIPYSAYWERTAALYDWDRMSEEEQLDKKYEIHTVRIHTLVACELSCNYCSVANTRRIASGSTKPSIVNLSTNAIEENLLAIKRSVPGVMTIYDSSDEAWLGRGRAEEYLGALEKVRDVMNEGLPRGMRYLIQCRTQDLDEEIIDRAAKVGVKHLTVGVESPIERVRKDIRKPQGEELVRNIIRWGAPRGIDIYMLFIMFLPTITLEELHQAVVNWRVYLELGATISVEPFCMAYLGTALHDDPTLITEHVGYNIPFSGGKKLKWATLIWPHDRRVCAVLQWFRQNVDAYIEEARKKLGHRHTFKGTTGKITVDCLEAALVLYDAGKLPPWEPGEGRRSMVYQDYGDQMSGSEIAAAAMDRKNTTASRFNSTHSLLDSSPNSGVVGRIKDPALPHEMVVKKEPPPVPAPPPSKTRFVVRNGLIIIQDVEPGQHATLFGPHGEKLPFRGDQSLFDDAKKRYSWVFDGAVSSEGDRFVFATADRAAAGTWMTDKFEVVDAHGVVVRGEGGKPVRLFPESASAVIQGVVKAELLRGEKAVVSKVTGDRPAQQYGQTDPSTATARRL